MRILIAALFAPLVANIALANPTLNAETHAPPNQQSIVGEAALVVDQFHDALAKGDRAAALAALDDQVQIYEQGWVERSKSEYASHHLDGDIEFSRSTTQTTTTRSGDLAGDMAYVATEGSVKGTFGTKAVDLTTLETTVLQRINGTWRITHIHWSSRDRTKK